MPEKAKEINELTPPKPKFGEEGDNAAITAFWICGVRALEDEKPDGRISDPYAKYLLNEFGWKHAKSRELFRLHEAIVTRTLHYDSKIMYAVKELGIRQMIMIGAGLDTRAWRLFSNGEFSDMHVIEVDHPNLFAYKEPRLKDQKLGCKRSIVALEYKDVTKWDEKAKELCGFDPRKPTVFVLEGVCMYIKPDDECDLYEKIDNNAALGSLVTGCNQSLILNLHRPKDMGNGIVWYTTDRNRIKTILKDWGPEFKRLHWFDALNCYMMMTGVKKPKGFYYQSNSLGLLKSMIVPLILAVFVYLKLN